MADYVNGIKYRSHDNPRQMFIDSLMSFREKMSNREFWQKPEGQRQDAIASLTQDYLRTDHKGNEEEDKTHYESAILEYNMRAKYMLEVSHE